MNIRHDTRFSSREDKAALLEELRLMVGVPCQEFVNFFETLRRCSHGYVHFTRGNFEVAINARNSPRLPESCEVELEIGTRGTEEDMSFTCRLSMVDLAYYFDREHTSTASESGPSPSGIDHDAEEVE